MLLENGYFRNPDGSRYLPMGMFSCYFRAEFAGEKLVLESQHGDNLLEFQHCTRGTWERLFEFLRREGHTAIRMFPRGDSGGAAWEGLDLGGRVNRYLLDLILDFARTARQYGIRLMLGLFTEPECSVYCREDTRVYWGARLWDEEMRAVATPSERRFLENTRDLVDYNDFFSDPDVRSCCHSFLDELVPLLRGNDDLFAIEVFNEMGWASPHANPSNTFRWEITPDYLDWSRDMVDHIRRLAPELPVCISNAGVGLLGHDQVQWFEAIRPDFFSLHNYPDIDGALPGTDYASVSDMVLKYTQLGGTAMYGEWQAIFAPPDPSDERLRLLNARDFAWLTMLSGAPGCIGWCARGYGQYRAVSKLFARLENRDLTPARPKRVVDVSAAHDWFVSLVDGGEDECRLPPHKWCPDRSATDHKHRFCVKCESEYHRRMVAVEDWSLRTGADYIFARGEGRPLLEWSREDFADEGPVGVPEGYRQKSLTAADGRTVIVYLQNFEPVVYSGNTVDGLPYEKFTLRTQSPRPVVLELRDPAFRYELLDLETGEQTALLPGSVGLGVTSHDFVLLLTR